MSQNVMAILLIALLVLSAGALVTPPAKENWGPGVIFDDGYISVEWLGGTEYSITALREEFAMFVVFGDFFISFETCMTHTFSSEGEFNFDYLNDGFGSRKYMIDTSLSVDPSNRVTFISVGP